MSDDHGARFLEEAASGTGRLGVDLGEWMGLRLAENYLARGLLLISTGDHEIDLHSLRTCSVRRLAAAVRDDDVARDRLAAGLYAECAADSIDEGHALIDALLKIWDRGERT